MAQGAVAIVSTNEPALTAEELREILEYEKILQFRDAVVAGTHPRIKVPPHLAGVGKQVNTARNVSPGSLSTTRANALPPLPTSSTPGKQFEDTSLFSNRSPNNHRINVGGHTLIAGKLAKSEINPILLEKSDDLIKAEIQLKRQKLERALREQIEHQRLATKAISQTSESLPNFDISEVLSKALTIVQPSTFVEIEPSVGAHSLASDSFDENSFYSSQHDTPEPSGSSKGQEEPVDVQARGVAVVSVYERPIQNFSSENHVGDRDMVVTGSLLSSDNHLAAQAFSQSQHSTSIHQTRTKFLDNPSELGNSESSNSRGAIAGEAPSNVSSQHKELGITNAHQGSSLRSANMTSQQVVDRMVAQKTTEELLKQAFENETTSPLIRAHNLSPIAPQPARVSPLATARDPPILRQSLLVDEAPPAQVAALRNKPSGISSTDSSPKGVKGSEKKKGKRKRRIASSKENPDTPDSPYIKPEPRSPSPFAVAPLPRPQKRQRQMGQYAAELNYDEPRYEPVEEPLERVPERYKEVREARAYERMDDSYEAEPRRPEPTYRRLGRDEGEYRRVSSHYGRRPQSPAVYVVPYTPSEGHPVIATSHAVGDRRILEEPRYYRDLAPRASVRPDVDRDRSRSPNLRERRSSVPMGPPRQPVRIVVDAYGREYIDPAPAPPMRQSVAPPVRYRDSEIVYERAPILAAASRAPVEAYEEDGVVYRRSPPPIAVPRRVITQPEYSVPEYRSYRQREYSGRPTATQPAEEYIQGRGAPERYQMSHFEDTPREYLPRATSTRPEPVRYEIPREYVGRLESVRADPPPREYAASVRPEPRREMIPQSQREFSVRVDSGHHREHLPTPENDRYYEGSSRRPAEVAFIERPRARESSVVVYADDVRREVYR